jgi:hypothetical protein
VQFTNEGGKETGGAFTGSRLEDKACLSFFGMSFEQCIVCTTCTALAHSDSSAVDGQRLCKASEVADAAGALQLPAQCADV